MEEKRRKQEETNKIKQEEKLKKMQEMELKRQQNALYKEQVTAFTLSKSLMKKIKFGLLRKSSELSKTS